MKIIYVSSLLPQSIIDAAFEKNKSVYSVAQHLFNRNVVRGLKANGHDVTVLSYIDDSIIAERQFNEDDLVYHFVKYNGSGLKKNFLTTHGIYKQIRKIQKSTTVDAIICDVLNVSSCLGALIASKRFHIPIVAIITDLMNIDSHVEKSLKIRLASLVNKNYIKRFDGYVLLTKYMNDVVNPLQKPFIVMEGICSPEDRKPCKRGDDLFRLFYAGGRPSKDGLNFLIPAFKRINLKNIRLDVYGEMHGVEVGEDPDDDRITYHGRAVNYVVREREFESDLLLNPRPVGERYTYYSFPSKVLEYMSTGIPMLTTKLAGIPEEYFDYVYTIGGNSEEEYYAALVKVLSLTPDELMEKGQKAKSFALKNKNYVKQASRICELIKNQDHDTYSR